MRRVTTTISSRLDRALLTGGLAATPVCTVSAMANLKLKRASGQRRHYFLEGSRTLRLEGIASRAATEKIGRVRRCMLEPYAFEGISTWLRRLDRFAQVVERTKGDR